MNNQEKLELAKNVFNVEISAMEMMRDSLDDVFVQIVDLISDCKGKVVLTGMGKPGHISRKIAATLASLGTPSFYLHPAEAQHGDLGMVSSDDIVIAISYSGESSEVIRLLPNLRIIGAKIVGITAKADSTLGKNSDIIQILPPFEEACYMHLAPTSSTTVELAYGDAMAVVAAKGYGFSPENFATFHPAGALGKKLILKVSDLMNSGAKNAISPITATLQEAIVEMSTKQLGLVIISDETNHIRGIITDGDLRRALERKVDIYSLQVDDIMTKTPICIHDGEMAVEALRVMKTRKISSMPVISEQGEILGSITLNDLIGAGLVI